jgi:hypothetical protein
MDRMPLRLDRAPPRSVRAVSGVAVPLVLVPLWLFVPGVPIYAIGWSFGQWYTVPIGMLVIGSTAVVGGLLMVAWLTLVAHYSKSKSRSRRR